MSDQAHRGPFNHAADCPAYWRGDLGSDCTCGQTSRTHRWISEHTRHDPALEGPGQIVERIALAIHNELFHFEQPATSAPCCFDAARAALAVVESTSDFTIEY
jgi:hypothetical protein